MFKAVYLLRSFSVTWSEVFTSTEIAEHVLRSIETKATTNFGNSLKVIFLVSLPYDKWNWESFFGHYGWILAMDQRRKSAVMTLPSVNEVYELLLCFFQTRTPRHLSFQFSGDFWCTAISSSCRVSQVLSFMSLLSNMKLINKDQRSSLGNEDEEKQLGLSTVKKCKKRIKEITMVLKKLK